MKTPRQIEIHLWKQMAELIQDIGCSHQNYAETDIGNDIVVMGSVIRHHIVAGPESQVSHKMMEEAESIMSKHGAALVSTIPVGRCIEMVEQLLGLGFNRLLRTDLEKEKYAKHLAFLHKDYLAHCPAYTIRDLALEFNLSIEQCEQFIHLAEQSSLAEES